MIDTILLKKRTDYMKSKTELLAGVLDDVSVLQKDDLIAIYHEYSNSLHPNSKELHKYLHVGKIQDIEEDSDLFVHSIKINLHDHAMIYKGFGDFSDLKLYSSSDSRKRSVEFSLKNVNEKLEILTGKNVDRILEDRGSSKKEYDALFGS